MGILTLFSFNTTIYGWRVGILGFTCIIACHVALFMARSARRDLLRYL